MTADPDPLPSLAPLQRVMLWDSLADAGAGHHVEQVEIVLTPGLTGERVAGAWEETVARTEALRTAFLTTNGMPAGLEPAAPRRTLTVEESLPSSWESWLEADRLRPLLAAHEVPWRATWWPQARRFIWTFHHALLDGRSIARVVRHFLARLKGVDAPSLALSRWRDPSPEMVAVADGMLRGGFTGCETPEFPAGPSGQAVRCLGNDCAMLLESRAAALEVTAATLLTWAWGQALAATGGTPAVLVEQVRAGAPQPGTAGFTMNTLPLVIHRAAEHTRDQSLHELRARSLALREIESVSPDDLPPGVFPNMDGPGTSVIMIERATLQHTVGAPDLVESLVLHESRGETLMATAYLRPDLRLEVEGPARHELLDAWIRVLRRLG